MGERKNIMTRRLHLHFLDVGAEALAQRACEQVRKLAIGQVEAAAGPQASFRHADIVILLHREGERRHPVHLPADAGCINWSLPKAGLDASIDAKASLLLRELGIPVRAAGGLRARPIDRVKHITQVAADALASVKRVSPLHAERVA